MPEVQDELGLLCTSVRNLVKEGRYDECQRMIAAAMGKYPHAPQPHNLMGLLLERQNDHLTAMKHFRAAWALDPTYLPARQNLELYGTFFSSGPSAYDETDCPPEEQNESHTYGIEYNAHGIGHVVRRNKK